MDKKKLAATELRNTLYRLRKDRGWSMAAMAELLSAKGVTAYQTTIAKIEAGDRAVQIDELVALADIFEVTTDALLGHSSTGTGDKFVQVSALADMSQRALWQIQSTQRALRDAVANVDGFKLDKQEKILRTGCANACAALADAATAIDDTTEAMELIFDLQFEDRRSTK